MLQDDTEADLESTYSEEQDLPALHQQEFIKDTPEAVQDKDLKKPQIPSRSPVPSYADIINKLKAQVNPKDRDKFDYVRKVLELSGFSYNQALGAWYSDDQPVDPAVYEELESSCIPHDSICAGNKNGECELLMLLFDLINEVLMDIYERSYSYYPKPLSSLSHIRPMPAGHHVLREVWENMNWYLRLTPTADRSLDSVVSKDLAKCDEWMSMQFESECVALEVEELVFEDLLDEVVLEDFMQL